MSAPTDNRNSTGVGSGLGRHEFGAQYYGPAAAGAILFTGCLAGIKKSDLVANTNPPPLYAFLGDGTMIAAGFIDIGAGQGGDTSYSLGARPIHVLQRTGTLVDLHAGGAGAFTMADLYEPVYGADGQSCSSLASDGPCIGMLAGIDPKTGLPMVLVDAVIASLFSGVDYAATAAEQVAAAGALSVAKRSTILNVVGTKAYTLANGTQAGQRKRIFCRAATATPVGTVTPATPNNFATLTFSTANAFAELEWNGASWDLVGIGGTVTVA